MENSDKGIAENMADMQIGETDPGFNSEPVASKDQTKKQWKQAMRHKMRLHLKMKKDMDGVHPQFAAGPLPWGQLFGHRHGPGRWRRQIPDMHRRGPMMYHMYGPVGNGPFMPGQMWGRMQRRHPGWFQDATTGSPHNYMMGNAGQINFDNHPFFMRRKWQKMANAARNKNTNAESSEKKDEVTDPNQTEQEPNSMQSQKGQQVYPAWFAASGFPPFLMTPGWKKGRKNKKQKQTEAAVADSTGESAVSEEEKTDLDEEKTTHSENATEMQQRKRDCLQRKRFRKMMIMQMMMQHSNPFINPWMAGLQPMKKDGCCKNRRQKKDLQSEEASVLEKDAIRNQDESALPGKLNDNKKPCRPGLQRQWRMHRMMMQNADPFLPPWMAVQQINKGRCGKCKRQEKQLQEGEKSGAEHQDDHIKQNERIPTGDSPAESSQKHNQCKPGCQRQRGMQRRMQMMQQAGLFMPPWVAGGHELYNGRGGWKKHRRWAEKMQKEDKDSEGVDEMDIQVEQRGDDQKEFFSKQKKPRGSPCRKRRMQMMRRAMKQNQGYGPHPFVHPWMFSAGQHFHHPGVRSDQKETQKPE